MDLIESAKNGDIGRVSELLDSGIDPNIKGDYGETALIWASRKGRIDIVELLLERGADPNIQNRDGETALTIASRRYLSYIDIVKSLLERGADPNIQNYDGNTALIITSNGDIIESLLDRRADINIQNNYGQTALIVASRKGRIDIVESLLDSGADPNIRNNDGGTALMIAEREGHDDIAELIYDHITLQRAQQNLAFTKYFMDYDDLDQDVASRLFGIERSYDPHINIRMLDETRRDKLTKSLQRLASMRSMHSREGPLGSIRYDPSIMQGVSEHLSRIAPIPSVHQRLMLEDRQTGSGRRRRRRSKSRRRRRKKYTRNRFY